MEPTGSVNGRGAGATSHVEFTGCHTGGTELAVLLVATLRLEPSNYFIVTYVLLVLIMFYFIAYHFHRRP